ncbi:MAG: hypothetical protein KDK36_13715 [Leptospiraceae bacterium]|nr:hypothetical protein [Leptospiraceae bacterium]
MQRFLLKFIPFFLLIITMFFIFSLNSKEINNPPHFPSIEDYILWELSDKKYSDTQMYYKFFPHFHEKRIGDWRTIPSPKLKKSKFQNIPVKSLPFKVKILFKKDKTRSKEKNYKD